MLDLLTLLDCPEVVPSFQGSPGEMMEGKIVPALDGVPVVLHFRDDEPITTHTDKSGEYRWFVIVCNSSRCCN